jgi:hypothetical protein
VVVRGTDLDEGDVHVVDLAAEEQRDLAEEDGHKVSSAFAYGLATVSANEHRIGTKDACNQKDGIRELKKVESFPTNSSIYHLLNTQ